MNSIIFLAVGLLIGSTIIWLFLHQKVRYTYDLAIAKIEKDKAANRDKQIFLADQKEVMKSEIQNVAKKVIEEESLKIVNNSKEAINNILSPLQLQITDFKQKVETVYDTENQSRATLYNEIVNLKNLNQKISQDAINLTNALKGDSKTQGAWGEIILERTLEMSGLNKGQEYDVQVVLNDNDGKRFLPDAIIKLPDKKDIIVDSKVSLTSYEQYCSCGDPKDKLTAIKNHIASIKQHIKELSQKCYQNLKNVNTVDFVLMFIPIEAAYIAALKEDHNLIAEAQNRNIIIVTPTTLLAVCKTIRFTWKAEYQSKNVKEIASKAGDLYDKFVGFLKVLTDASSCIKKSSEKLDIALQQLGKGRGNLINRVEHLKKLGVNSKKEIPKELLFGSEKDEYGVSNDL